MRTPTAWLQQLTYNNVVLSLLCMLLPIQSQTNPWAFCLSYWELYGYFYKLRGKKT